MKYQESISHFMPTLRNNKRIQNADGNGDGKDEMNSWADDNMR